MIHFQEIIVHTAVTPKQIAIALYRFTSELHPIKADPSRDTATLVNSPSLCQVWNNTFFQYFFDPNTAFYP